VSAVADRGFLRERQQVIPPERWRRRDQSIQLGDGGVGVIFQLQAYRKLPGGMSGYVYGWYLLTPREKTGVASPLAGVPLSVPDVYSVRSGVSSAL